MTSKAPPLAALRAALGQQGYRFTINRIPTHGLFTPETTLPLGTLCSDCSTFDNIVCCSECFKPVCPKHRSGQDVSDSYQCSKRDCGAVSRHRVFWSERNQHVVKRLDEPPAPDDPALKEKTFAFFIEGLADQGLRPASPLDPASERVETLVDFCGNSIKIACIRIAPPDGGHPS